AIPKMLVNAIGDQELGVLRPTVVALGEPDFLLAKRLPMGGASILLRGRTPGDVAFDNDQRRAVVRLLEYLECAVEHVEVVGVPDARNVPAQAHELGSDVLAESEARVPFNGDSVAVIDPAQLS